MNNMNGLEQLTNAAAATASYRDCCCIPFICLPLMTPYILLRLLMPDSLEPAVQHKRRPYHKHVCCVVSVFFAVSACFFNIFFSKFQLEKYFHRVSVYSSHFHRTTQSLFRAILKLFPFACRCRLRYSLCPMPPYVVTSLVVIIVFY